MSRPRQRVCLQDGLKLDLNWLARKGFVKRGANSAAIVENHPKPVGSGKRPHRFRAEAQVAFPATFVATFANRTASASLRASRRFPPGEFNRTPDTSFPASFAVLIAALSVSVS